MTETTKFESREALISCTAGEFYSFMTDFRNMRQFLPEGNITGSDIGKESASFRIDPLGDVKIWLTERDPLNKITCSGIALGSNPFSLLFRIDSAGNNRTSVIVTLNAEMNSFLKMVAAGPISKFLEVLVEEMEKFTGWNRPYQ